MAAGEFIMHHSFSFRAACLLGTSLAMLAWSKAGSAQQHGIPDAAAAVQHSGAAAKRAKAAANAAETDPPSGKAMETIVVLGQRTPARIARQAQKEAPNLILVQPYQ